MHRLLSLLGAGLLALAGSPTEASECEAEGRLAMATAVRPVAEIEALLSEGIPAEPSEACRGSRTPLEIAAERGRTDVVQLLLRHGAEVGRAPLWAASQQDDPALMRLLIEALPEDQRAAGLKDGLESAASRGHHAALAELLTLGADPAAPGVLALEYAAAAGDPEGVRLLLTAGFPADDPRAMRAALQAGDAVSVERALQAGADPHAEIPRMGNAISLLAAASGPGRAARDTEVADLLLARSVDPDVPYLGQRPLSLARERGAEPLAQRLEQAGARSGSTLGYKIDRVGRAVRRAAYAVVLLLGGGH